MPEFIIVRNNTLHLGIFSFMETETMFEEHRCAALEMAENIEWDEIILYAIYFYLPDTQTVYSSDFMLLRMSRKKYIELISTLSKNCRLFFVKCRRQ